MRFEIAGAVLALDILDDGDHQRVLGAFAAAREAALAADWDGMGGADAERLQCGIVFTCFDAVFGDGTAGRVFGARCTAARAVAAFEQLAAFVNGQKGDFEAAADEAARRYGPQRACLAGAGL